MISEMKDTHLYIKPEYNEKNSFGSQILSSDFSSDIVIDLLSFESTDESLFSYLNQIDKVVVSMGFCMVIVLKETPSISNIESLKIVPTMVEAEDYIQMEQIQRDLGLSL